MLPKVCQTLRVGQRLHSTDRPPVYGVPDRDLGDLAAVGPWHVWHGEDAGRHVPWRAVHPNRSLDLIDELGGQLSAVRECDEEHNPLVTVDLLADRYRVHDLGKPRDLTVDLCGADPHPARVEGRVRAAGDDESAVRRAGDPITVPPYVREDRKVCLGVSAPILVAPEPKGQGRK